VSNFHGLCLVIAFQNILWHIFLMSRVSGNYSSVIAIIVARNFIENQPQGVLR
jgi:hypothetical protein